MRIVVLSLLLLSAHFSLTPFAPAAAGKNWLFWPFATTSQPVVSFIGGLPQQSGSVVTPLLAALAGMSFLAAALGLYAKLVPEAWWPALVIIGTVASILLYLLYFGAWSLVPLVIDAALLWGVLILHWSVLSLRGA